LGLLEAASGSIARASDKKQVDKKENDQDDRSNDNMKGAEAKDSLLAVEVGWRDVSVFVVAFVMMFGHADKITFEFGLAALSERIFFPDVTLLWPTAVVLGAVVARFGRLESSRWLWARFCFGGF
jgi:hypothetical protein